MIMNIKNYVLLIGLMINIKWSAAQPKVIIKLDDLGSKNGLSSAQPVLDDLLKKKIKVAIGVIASRLDSTARQAYGPYINAINDKGEKLFEVWNHGFDHSKDNPPNMYQEFKGTSYAFQLDHFNRADQRVKTLLGVTMHTFGAPYNASDSTFNEVIKQNPNYKISMLNNLKTKETNGVLNYNNRVDMESSTGNVNYEYFVKQYQQRKSRYPDYIILQGHPNNWDAAKLAQFDLIIDYLISRGCEFVLPFEYYLTTVRK
jgi:peptidoglycan/xylan/chitin deacetylase (PgdA/CDA1 family)